MIYVIIEGKSIEPKVLYAGVSAKQAFVVAHAHKEPVRCEVWQEKPKSYAPDTRPERIRELLSSTTEALRPTQIARALADDPSGVRVTLFYMKQRGQVVESNGLYSTRHQPEEAV